MPKAKIQEEETHPPEEEVAPVQDTPPEPVQESPPEDAPVVPETPVQETVPKPRAKAVAAKAVAAKAEAAKAEAAKAKAKVRKDAPKKTNKKEAWAPGEVTIPQPPALLRQTTEPELPQLTQAQALRMHLATAAQERRAQAHMRVVTPIRQFYGL